MQRRKLIIWAVFNIVMGLSISIKPLKVEGSVEKNTEVGVYFEKEITSNTIELSKPPILNNNNNQKPILLLPKTGELLNSLIIMLIGVSLVIFCLGLIFIKQLFQTIN